MNKMQQHFSKCENLSEEQFIKIHETHAFSFFVGKERGCYAFEFRGHFKPRRTLSSGLIHINTFPSAKGGNFLRMTLMQKDYIEYFSILCQDLVDFTEGMEDAQNAYEQMLQRIKKWTKFFKHRDLLNEKQIMGLIGELLFLKDYMLPMYGEVKAFESWVGPEKTRKDFSVETEWFEVKAITAGNQTVKISSIEQLDSETVGKLVVFHLEKMSQEFSGITINQLVTDIHHSLSIVGQDLLGDKLLEYEFSFNPEYDKYTYELKQCNQYTVTEKFPKLMRKNLPIAISKAQYEINLSDIEPFKN